MDSVNVELKRLVDGVQVPGYAYEGDAGVDLRSVKHVILEPHQRAMVPTGLAIGLPKGYAGFVMPRSGLAAKHGISIVNTPGLIDSNYRGELKIILVNHDDEQSFEINVGDRIAQLVIMPVPTVRFHEVEQLSETVRGEAGFGSSGVHA